MIKNLITKTISWMLCMSLLLTVAPVLASAEGVTISKVEIGGQVIQPGGNLNGVSNISTSSADIVITYSGTAPTVEIKKGDTVISYADGDKKVANGKMSFALGALDANSTYTMTVSGSTYTFTTGDIIKTSGKVGGVITNVALNKPITLSGDSLGGNKNKDTVTDGVKTGAKSAVSFTLTHWANTNTSVYGANNANNHMYVDIGNDMTIVAVDYYGHTDSNTTGNEMVFSNKSYKPQRQANTELLLSDAANHSTVIDRLKQNSYSLFSGASNYNKNDVEATRYYPTRMISNTANAWIDTLCQIMPYYETGKTVYEPMTPVGTLDANMVYHERVSVDNGVGRNARYIYLAKYFEFIECTELEVYAYIPGLSIQTTTGGSTDSKVVANISLVKSDLTDNELWLIIAEYDSDGSQLSECKLEKIDTTSVTTGGLITKTAELTYENNKTYQAFLWNTQCMPLADKVTMQK